MHEEVYLGTVLRQKTKLLLPKPQAIALRAAILPTVKMWAGPYLCGIVASGSLAKGTAVEGSSDLDLFVSLKPVPNFTLRDIFENLGSYLSSAGLSAKARNVSYQVVLPGGTVDLVPGRVQPGMRVVHSLYCARTGSWVKTNVSMHIGLMQAYGHRDIVRLAKIWRDCWDLEFPSFFLELCVIEALRGRKLPGLARRFGHVLNWLSGEMPGRKILDPANTNNVVSDTVSASDKRTIATQAASAIAASYWSHVLW